MTGDHEKRDFLRRWSQLKTRARSGEEVGTDAANTEAQSLPVSQPHAQVEQREKTGERPAVPPVESLGIESDYRPFFHPKIEEGVRRAALKKLFSDPHFNVMDGLDVYIDDYSKSDPLPAGMLEQLEQAKKILAWSREDAEERAKAEGRDSAASAAAAPAASTELMQAPESTESVLSPSAAATKTAAVNVIPPRQAE